MQVPMIFPVLCLPGSAAAPSGLLGGWWNSMLSLLLLFSVQDEQRRGQEVRAKEKESISKVSKRGREPSRVAAASSFAQGQGMNGDRAHETRATSLERIFCFVDAAHTVFTLQKYFKTETKAEI
ncbi:hypothetical protein R1flu_010404 [Riccia fluitans]|uniref:Secreted protein n=1 Tax=Riccia fluitans TaxID=41844 RepID=A0ABD1Z7X1_9MARC